VGSQSLLAHTTGNYNVAVGQNALVSNTTASDNTSVGAYSLDANTTGANNTAVGKEALGSNTTASNNTAVGYQAGYMAKAPQELSKRMLLEFCFWQLTLTTGNNNSILGRFTATKAAWTSAPQATTSCCRMGMGILGVSLTARQLAGGAMLLSTR
jgi:hypothetical protein